MPDERFSVKLLGLDADEIAKYALRILHCADCKAGPGRKCKGAPKDRIVCRERFVAAVNAIAHIGERFIRMDLEKASSLDKANFTCRCKQCAEWHPSK